MVKTAPSWRIMAAFSDTIRRDIEEKLKAGELPALVGTSSLELGIDIGSIDLVVQLQSPKTVTQGLATHWKGRTQRRRNQLRKDLRHTS